MQLKTKTIDRISCLFVKLYRKSAHRKPKQLIKRNRFNQIGYKLHGRQTVRNNKIDQPLSLGMIERGCRYRLFIYISTQLTNTPGIIIHSNRNRSIPTLVDFPRKLNENFITVLTLRSETYRVMAFVAYKKRLIQLRSALYSPFALAS